MDKLKPLWARIRAWFRQAGVFIAKYARIAWAAVAAFFAGVGAWCARMWKRGAQTLREGKTGTGIPGRRKAAFVPRTKQPHFLLCVGMNVMKLTIVAMLVLAVSGLGGVLGVAKAYWDSTKALNLDELSQQAQTSFIYDCNGKLITEYKGTENRIWVSFEDIPAKLYNAFIAIEDSRFWDHQGVDTKRLVGSFISNMSGGSVQGGSTITQQLVKIRLLSSERTYKRKIQEAYLATELERELSKEEILEYYLNSIPLGESNYGVLAAAKDYFGKDDLNDLTLRECATLAATTANPYQYNVRRNYYVKNTPERIDNRAKQVLFNMYQQGYISKEEMDAANAEKLEVVEERSSSALYDMPYFVEYVIYDVTTHLLNQKKLEDTTQNRNLVEREIRTSGYHIYTTVDPEVQGALEDTIYNYQNWPSLKNSRDRVEVTTNPDGTKSEVEQPQAAAAVFDHATGQLKGIVGGRFAPTQRKQLNRAYQAHMPVGSSIKPLAVYGPALDLGASPASIVYNLPLTIAGWGDKGYPSNYGGGGFTGPVTLRYAMRRSLNTPAAQTLFNLVGVTNSRDYLINMGVSPSSLQVDGPGLAVGTSGITPIEMAVAFGMIANKGVYQEPISFTRVEDSKGNVVYDATQNQVKRQVFKTSTAYMLTDMLKDAINNGTGSNARIPGMDVYGKTGTNSDYRGVFFAGFTPYYSASVWIGSDGYKQLYIGAQGGRDAAPLWQAFMARIHEVKGLENKAIYSESPEELGLEKHTICSISGLAPTEECELAEATVTDWFLAGTEPTTPCNMHQKLRMCKDGQCPAGQYCPEESIEETSAVVIPADSQLNQLNDEQLQSYFPNSVRETELQKYQENEEEYVCSFHDETWQTGQEERGQAVETAQQKFQEVAQMLEGLLLLPADQQQLEQLRAAADEAIADPESTAVDILDRVNALISFANEAAGRASSTSPTPGTTE